MNLSGFRLLFSTLCPASGGGESNRFAHSARLGRLSVERVPENKQPTYQSERNPNRTKSIQRRAESDQHRAKRVLSAGRHQFQTFWLVSNICFCIVHLLLLACSFLYDSFMRVCCVLASSRGLTFPFISM